MDSSRLASYLVVSFVAAVLGCGTPPAAKKPVVPTPNPTPFRDAVRVEKAVNVRFSTYSTEWPVGWEWIDPEERYAPVAHDVKNGVLRLRLTAKKDLANSERTAPRYLKAIAGDFQIDTLVKFNPTQDFQGAGLLIYVNDANYITFERAYGGVAGGASGLRLDRQTVEGYSAVVTPKDIQFDGTEVELRLVRSGGLVSALWRGDENDEWREAAIIETDFPETVLAGLVARNTAGEMSADFRYVRLLPP